jgi:hypothetical protein
VSQPSKGLVSGAARESESIHVTQLLSGRAIRAGSR